jgi:uncharacterized SAM-dependent methyltransferase
MLSLDRIFIFKTDIVDHHSYNKLAEFLNQQADVIRWNLDMQDCDHVLRIESEKENIEFYMSAINDLSIICEELPD